MNVETVIVRDPDGPTDVWVFAAGEPVEPAPSCIDAGAGWVWEDWCAHRDWMLENASPAAWELMHELLDNPPGGNYVESRNDRPWLDPAPTGTSDTGEVPMTNTNDPAPNAAALGKVENIDDLAALCSGRGAAPTADSVPDPAESNALRGLLAGAGLVPYVQRCGTAGDEFEVQIADLIGDLHHLADAVGVDWDCVTSRASSYHGEELSRV
ncbi:MAG: hypothetical protein WAW17_16920 [Rhodococcus sp. (in: high G+C Gram-positive bacteria)]|uniref:hypothetical protein n=1 Tax=Rhodococcus sp. TaxID=1831 RepID=UPI003BB088F7